LQKYYIQTPKRKINKQAGPQLSRTLGHDQEKPNQRICGVEKEAKIQTKGIGNLFLFNDIIAENFPNLGKDMAI
jgi:hypothetical protein